MTPFSELQTEKIVTALRKARKYIRTIEVCRNEGFIKDEFEMMINVYVANDEIQAINDALLELGVVV